MEDLEQALANSGTANQLLAVDWSTAAADKTLTNQLAGHRWIPPSGRHGCELDKVTFRYKDYRHDAQYKTMTLEAKEFIRRCLLHVLLRALYLPQLAGMTKKKTTKPTHDQPETVAQSRRSV
jgi:hypothetical protein